MGKRHTARKIAMQVLYQMEILAHPASEILHHLAEEEKIHSETKMFAGELLQLVQDHVPPIDRQIRAHLHDWEFDRLSLVDKSILRLATAELLFHAETDPAVVIHEAVELADQFGTEGSGRFVNGILGAIFRDRYNAPAVE